MTQPEKLRYQVFFNGEWNDETENTYWSMVQNNHHGRVLNSKGVIVESTPVETETQPNEGREEKHTGGPWESAENIYPTPESAKASEKYTLVFGYSGHIRRHIADVYGMDDEEIRANAELIASAPTLRDQLSKEREKNENPENLLVEMSVTLNNLVRAYDQKDDGLMKFTMQKAHDLSHKGIGHLTELDKLNEQLEKEREMRKELVNGLRNAEYLLQDTTHEVSWIDTLCKRASDLKT